MWHKVRILFILIVFHRVAPIRTAFRDFVIEKEEDLQHFDHSRGEIMYDELLNDDESYSHSGLASSCDDYGDYQRIDAMPNIFDEDENSVFTSKGYDLHIDNLPDVIRQLVNEALIQRFPGNIIGEHDFSLNDDAEYFEDNPNTMCIGRQSLV